MDQQESMRDIIQNKPQNAEEMDKEPIGEELEKLLKTPPVPIQCL